MTWSNLFHNASAWVKHIVKLCLWGGGGQVVYSTRILSVCPSVMAILPLPLIQEEQLSVTGERMCTKYW